MRCALSACALLFAIDHRRDSRARDAQLGRDHAAARGQTVYWNAWAGDERTNAFIAWVGDEVKKRHGVTVQQVNLKDTAEAVTRVVSEKTAGRDRDGSVDLIWINGPNFLAMKDKGLLHGPFTQAMPNYRLVDVTTKRSNVVDFTVPVDGLESPWRLAQVVYVYDSARHRPESMPRSINALLDWSRAQPGPADPSDRAQLPRRDLPEAGALRARADAGGAAEPGHRRDLRGDDRAALGLVRQAAADACGAPARSSPRAVRRSASC